MVKRSKLTMEEAGARGGRAGGSSKRRGGPDHYRGMSRKRWGEPIRRPTGEEVRTAAAELMKAGAAPKLPRPATRKRIRTAARIPAAVVAQLCDVSRQTVHTWEAGAEPGDPWHRALYVVSLGLMRTKNKRG